MLSTFVSVKTAAITASSEWPGNHGATNALLDFKEASGRAGSWAAGANDGNQWLLFDLGQRSTVGVIRTQGRQGLYDQWVTSYSISYGNSSGDEMDYKDTNGDTIVFTGNSDRNSLVTHVLGDYNGPFHARYVKFHPVTWYGHISMRADIGEVAPVGFWPLNGHTHLSDVSGYGNDAIGVGVYPANGVHGEIDGAYSLSGSSTSYIEIPNNGMLDTRYSITMLAYVYPTGTDGPIFNYRTDDFGVHLWQTGTNHLQGRMLTREHVYKDPISVSTLNLNEWNFVGMTYSYPSGKVKLWHDGTEVGTLDVGTFETETDYDIRVGLMDGDSRIFAGRIACLQIYNIPLNIEQIREAAAKCKAVQPAGLWPLNKQYSLADISGNGNDVTGSNVALGSGVYGEPEGAYVLSGSTTSYIEIPDDGTLDTRYSLTILASVYPTGESGPILHYGDSTTTGVHLWQDSTNVLLTRVFSRNAATSQTTQARCIKPNQWNFVGLTYNYYSGILKLWYEGLELISTDIGVYELGTNHAARIGAVGSDYFKGSVSCVQVYDVALNQSQIEHAATLCTGNNIAVGKTAEQSSVYSSWLSLFSSWEASHAVDGYKGSDVNEPACAQTQSEVEPWWKLDLGGSYVVVRVRLLNRWNEQGERLEEFQVRVGENSDISQNSICGRTTNQLDDPPHSRTITVDCAQPITGRYVSVQLIDRTDYLTLCEVEVFEGQENDAAWLTLDFSSVISSAGTPKNDDGIVYDAFKALDGNLLTYWHPKGVTDNHYYVTLDLKEYYWLSKIRVVTYEEDDAATHHIAAFTIKTAVNTTGSWTDVTSFSGLAGRQVKAFTGFVAMSRYWKVDITQTSHGQEPFVAEIQLYGRLVYPTRTTDVLTFPLPKSTANYVKLPTSLSQPLTEITTCLHMRSEDTRLGAPVSYDMSNNDFVVYGNSADRIKVYVNNQQTTTFAVSILDGSLHFLCVTWSSTAGDWKVYANGTEIASGSGLALGQSIPSGGTWILGQEQDRPGGGFNASDAFAGEISLLNVWDRALTEAEIGATCGGTAGGNIINWGRDTFELFGQVWNRSTTVECGKSLLMPSFYGFDIYKVPVGGFMTSANLRTACEAQGMQTVCWRANEEAYPDEWHSYCQTIPIGNVISSLERPQEVLAQHICGSIVPKDCAPLHNTFVARRGWRPDDGACGVIASRWCQAGHTQSNMDALCARVSEASSAVSLEEPTYHCNGDKPSYVTMATNGTITSGDHGWGNYSSDSLCSWSIEAPSGMAVSLTFLTFDLADDGDCLSDYVAVYDGSNQSSVLLGRFCESNPGVVNSTGTLMHVTFVSNSSLEASGFQATFGQIQTSSNASINPAYVVRGCEYATVTLSCPSGSVLHTSFANYGRVHRWFCGFTSSQTYCASDNAESVVRSACDNQQDCQVVASNSAFGDPCPGESKYLEVSYQCDVDECATGNGGCSQNCTNTIGSFSCSCQNGYTLNGDSVSCDGWDLPASCPTDSYINLPNNKTYVSVSGELVDYATAQAGCTAVGGMVAVPLDSNELAYLVFYKNCLDEAAQFWAGLTLSDGTWVDSQGTALGGFSAWAPGEPNGGKICSHLVRGTHTDSQRVNMWADALCTVNYRYICETSKSLLMPSFYGFDIYKVPVGGYMISANLRTACEAQGMQTVCWKANEASTPGRWHSYCQSIPVGTEISSLEKPQEVLAHHICGSINPKTCAPLLNTFVALRGWQTNDGACGVTSSTWCQAGQTLSNMDALCATDVDECATGNGGCSKNCTNTIGSFSCSCQNGYTLNNDSVSCDAIQTTTPPPTTPASTTTTSATSTVIPSTAGAAAASTTATTSSPTTPASTTTAATTSAMVPSTVGAAAASTTGPDWTQHGSNQYTFLESTSVTYIEARALCEAFGAKIGMPKDQATHDFVVQYRNQFSSDVDIWIGLNDMDIEGNFVWEDGTSLGSFNPWMPGQPNNIDEQDCVVIIKATNGDPNQWRDDDCSGSRRVICEKAVQTTTPPPTTPPTTTTTTASTSTVVPSTAGAAVATTTGAEFEWQHIAGGLTFVSVGLSGVWGVDSDYQIYYRTGTYKNEASPGTGWELIDGGLKQISSGNNTVWGVSSNDDIFIRLGISSSAPQGSRWSNVSGKLKQVHVSSTSDQVWGVNSGDNVYRRLGITTSNLAGTSWQQISPSGGLKYVSIGKAGVWGVSSNDQIFYRAGTFDNEASPGTEWVPVSGNLKQISSGNGEVWGVDMNNQIYVRRNISAGTPQGSTWQLIEGSLEKVSISSSSNQVWGVNATDNIYRRQGQRLTTPATTTSQPTTHSDANTTVVSSTTGTAVATTTPASNTSAEANTTLDSSTTISAATTRAPMATTEANTTVAQSTTGTFVTPAPNTTAKANTTVVQSTTGTDVTTMSSTVSPATSSTVEAQTTEVRSTAGAAGPTTEELMWHEQTDVLARIRPEPCHSRLCPEARFVTVRECNDIPCLGTVCERARVSQTMPEAKVRSTFVNSRGSWNHLASISGLCTCHYSVCKHNSHFNNRGCCCHFNGKGYYNHDISINEPCPQRYNDRDQHHNHCDVFSSSGCCAHYASVNGSYNC
ncbi:uncharacterized protein [Branchiostoma lanceolatum]|uniref:uncharacterized protein n=1 Tax=Branchiostoma lanceolatum TaxID=7740 RepID=UPI003454288A